MAASDRSAPSFVDFPSLYAHLEERAHEYPLHLEIAQFFLGLRVHLHAQGKHDEVRLAQHEVDIFHFRTQRGGLLGMWSSVDDKGKSVEYPRLDAFDADALKYIHRRSQESRHPLLRARYAHVLWGAEKHQRYAQLAVDAYLDLAKLYEEKDGQIPKSRFGFGAMNALKDAFGLAVLARLDVTRPHAEVRRLVREFNRQSNSCSSVRFNLIKFMLDTSRHFSASDFDGIQEICWETVQQARAAGDMHFSIEMLAVGSKVDAKTKRQTHPWKRQMAECYEVLMAEAEAKKNLACTHFCQEAMALYRELNDGDKVKDLHHRYEQLKTAVPLAAFRYERDVTETMKKIHDLAEKITEKAPETIIFALMHNNVFLPSRAALDKAVETTKDTPELLIIPKSVIDTEGHTAQHFSTDDERQRHALLWAYHEMMQFPVLVLLNEVLRLSVRKDKISSAVLLSLLRSRSWLGTPLHKDLVTGATEEYDWVSLAAPAVQEYFEQLLQVNRDSLYRPNFILSTDSLTLKLEGILRDLCHYRGGMTSTLITDDAGRKIWREKDANALLHDETLIAFLPEEDLLFLRYLLVEQAGLNLRNRVAHSLILPSHYCEGFVQLLLLALLRLGRFSFKPRDASDVSG